MKWNCTKPFDFVAIDFETATDKLNSACAIGLAAVRDGEIVQTEYSLIKPPDLNFSPQNIEIHGITSDMVVDSPTLDDLWSSVLWQYFGPNLIVAHNARFDMSVLKCSLAYPACPDFKYIDSTSVARDFVPGVKSLAHCAEHFGINMGQHHNALDDAITCAKIVLNCLELSGLSNIGQLCFSRDNIKIHNFSDLQATASIQSKAKQKPSYSAYTSIKDIKPKTENFDEANPFFQKKVVFTGTFSISRDEIMQIVADVGANLKSSVSRKTDYLVVGEPDANYTDENGKMQKERTAIELNESGKAHIRIINEEEFRRLLEGGVSI